MAHDDLSINWSNILVLNYHFPNDKLTDKIVTLATAKSLSSFQHIDNQSREISDDKISSKSGLLGNFIW